MLKGLVLTNDGSHYTRLRQGYWLYLYLLLKAHPDSGKLVMAPEKAASETGVKVETVRSWLGHLRKQGYLHARRQGQVYVLTLSNWSVGRNHSFPELIPDEDYENGYHELTPEELTKRLGNGDGLSFYRSLCDRYPQDILCRALSEVEAIPAERIKKSRGALFTYLVKKYAQEEKENNNSGN